MTTVKRRVAEIAKKATGPALKRGYLAEEYDGIGSSTSVKMSQGSSSAVLASVSAGAFGTEQTYPADTPVMVLEYAGRLEVVSLGSKMSAGSITLEMFPSEGLPADGGIGSEPEKGSFITLGTLPAEVIVPGTLTSELFDASMKIPVAWATDPKPTLPDTSYPVDTLLYWTIDHKLYRNVADVWTAEVDGADIKATSILAGSIAAGQIGTGHLQAGAITLYDENEVAVLTPAGWAGSWSDFAALGLYNGQLRGSATGTIPDGRTEMLPYWTVSRDATNPCVLTREADTSYPSGYRLRVTWAAAGKTLTIVSDPVGVIGGHVYSVPAVGSIYSTAFEQGVEVRGYIDWYTATGSLISSSYSLYEGAYGETSVIGPDDGSAEDAPRNASYAQVRLVVSHTGTSATSCYLDLGSVGLVASALTLNPADSYSLNYLTATGNVIADSLIGATLSASDWLIVGATSNPFIVDTNGVITDYANNVATAYTPVVTGGGSGTTWTTRQASYFKIGKMVFWQCEVVINVVGTGGGTISIDLPSEPGTNQVIGGYASGFTTFSTGPVTGLANSGAASVAAIRDQNNVTLSRTHFVTGALFRLTGFYLEA